MVVVELGGDGGLVNLTRAQREAHRADTEDHLLLLVALDRVHSDLVLNLIGRNWRLAQIEVWPCCTLIQYFVTLVIEL